MKKILCMGSITMDMLMNVAHFPLPGETVKTDNFVQNPGGKGSNQAVTAAKLGGHVKYYTKLGGDALSANLLSKMEHYGIDMGAVVTDESLSAGVALVLVDGSGQNSCSFFPGACMQLRADEILRDHHVFDDCGILLVTMEMPPETVFAAIRTAKEKGLTVILDPAPVPPQGIPREIAQLVDYIKPNETEAEQLTGVTITNRQSAGKALAALLEQGFLCPILTLGKDGCMAVIEGEEVYFSPVRVKSVDTTAAGDVFLGSFAAALAESKCVQDCIDRARTAAAISTTRFGAQSSIPSSSDIQNFII